MHSQWTEQAIPRPDVRYVEQVYRDHGNRVR